MRHKKDMLLMDLLATAFTILALYCVGSISGAFSFCVIFLVLIFANIKERVKKKWTGFYVLFQVLYLLILIYAYQGISSVLVFTTSTIGLFYTWWLPPQKMRLIGGYNSILFLAYQISIKNWPGLLEILIALSNFAAYLKYRSPKRYTIKTSHKKGK